MKDVVEALFEQKREEREANELENADDLAEYNRLIAVEGNDDVTFYLLEDGRLFCSGKSKYGLIGRGEKESQNCDVVIYESNTRKLFRVPVPEKVIDIKVGRNHALALTLYGEVYAWGQNNGG